MMTPLLQNKIKTIVFFFFFFFFFCPFRAVPAIYGNSQDGSQIRAVDAGLHSHTNCGSQLSLQPSPQLTASLDPRPTEQSQGSNLVPHGY